VEAFLIQLEKTTRTLNLALRSLWLHKLRAFLSVLGIIIGTAAVISLLALGEGSMNDALEDIKRAGATNIIIRSVKPSDDSTSSRRTSIIRYGLTAGDHKGFQMIDSVMRSVPMRMFPQEIRRLHRMANGRVVGTTQAYQDVNQLKVVKGRFLRDGDEKGDEGDDTDMRNVAVIGSEIAATLFPLDDPVGQSIVLNKQQFVVVGVLDERMPTGSIGGSSGAEEYNSDVYIPLTTCRGRYGERIYLRSSGSRGGEEVELHQVTLTISEMDKVRSAGAAVRDQLETSHPKKDYAVTVPLDRLEEAERTRDRYTIFLFFIAGISLFVGGIGIMNIMLATVTERTREIGIRRALGAKRSDITFQFLIEAMAQTIAGGLFGLMLGLAVVYGLPPLAALFGMNLPAKLHVNGIYLSLMVDLAVGVLFGLYPAFRASRLDPIEALRHD
jgi:putative ABC transport system permease protein